MSTIVTRPGHPLVHEAPPRDVEWILLSGILVLGAVLIATIVLLMATV